jgi:hypothetical protein
MFFWEKTDQLQIAGWPVRSLLAHAKANPGQPVAKKKKCSRAVVKLMEDTLQAMMMHRNRDPNMSAKQLETALPVP